MNDDERYGARVPWWDGIRGLAYIAWCAIADWLRGQRDGFLVGYYARRILDEDSTLHDLAQDGAIHGVSYTLVGPDGPRRIDPRDVEPVIIRPLGPLEFAFLIAWTFLWLGLIWAAATGRL